MIMEHETFWTLLQNASHWEFELFLMFIFDVVIGLFLWPRIKRWKRHHTGDDNKLKWLEQQVQWLLQNMTRGANDSASSLEAWLIANKSERHRIPEWRGVGWYVSYTYFINEYADYAHYISAKFLADYGIFYCGWFSELDLVAG